VIAVYAEVPGARLYYELHGDGPPVVLVPGASGTGESFRRLADHLKQYATVVLYDRRGFSRSHLDGEPPRERLRADVDDVGRLIGHVDRGPATVVGASSGAIVALEALARHPSMITTTVAHEPPIMGLLSDGEEWLTFFASVYDRYRRDGAQEALASFRTRVFAPSDVLQMAGAPHNAANADFWFEHELRQYPAVELDLDRLGSQRGHVVPAAGRASIGRPCARAAVELARALGQEVLETPGGHVGFVGEPAGFADAIRQTLP
jgi:pimeloyl-ACP methyl ester carboxylesterase